MRPFSSSTDKRNCNLSNTAILHSSKLKSNVVTNLYIVYKFTSVYHKQAGLAQSVERQALNLMVEGSSPSVGASFLHYFNTE
jgi:hypothetical protein